MIYKPLRRSRLVREDGVSLIYTSPVTEAHADCFDSIAYAPCLLQRHIPKRLDVRVTVIGASVFAVAIRSQDHPEARNDWRRGSTLQLAHELHALPSPIEQLCARLVRELGLAFGAIDLVLTPDGEYVFLEINPNGQWAWIQQICPKVPLRETLADLLIGGGSQ